MHADHVLGLPGLLLTLVNPRKGNGEPLTIYGLQPLQWLALRSFLLNSVEPAIRDMALALALGSWSVASALLPTLAGILLDRGLVRWPLILGVLCYGAALLWFWLTLRHRALPAPDGQEGRDHGDHSTRATPRARGGGASSSRSGDG